MPSLTARLKAIPYPALLGGLMLLRLVAAARAGLVPDEAYYWLWAQHPAFGYYDHPPMVAWWIWPGNALSIMTWPLFVRGLFVLSFIPLSLMVYDTAKLLFGQDVARRSLLWLNACVMLSIGTVIATPDPPSVLMWAGGLWALALLVTSGDGRWWLVFGLFAGLGVEAKYTNFFLGLGVLAWVALDRDARKWLCTPWPYAGAAVALAAMLPNLMWNAQHHWLTIGKQFGRLAPAPMTARYLIEFLVSQPLLLNPLVFIFVVTAVQTWRKGGSNGRSTLLIALPAPALFYLLIHALHDRVQGNWTAPLFPGLVVLAAAGASEIESKWLPRVRTWAAPLGIGVTVLALVFLALGPQAPRLPGAASAGQGWDRLVKELHGKANLVHAGWIATTDYDTQGELSYYGQLVFYGGVVPFEERDRYAWWRDDPAMLTQPALIVVAANRHPDLSHCFADINDQGAISRGGKGARSTFHLYTGHLKTLNCELAEPSLPSETPVEPHDG
ncbi:MAG: ArnT family glycosyltransferase [Asticcacaulis sp.]